MSRAVMEKVDTMSEHMGKVSQRMRLQEEATVIKINLTETKNPFNGLIGRELKNLSAWNYLNRNVVTQKTQRKTLM